MLRKLQIRNYAIIEELEIEFSNKLNIITGETGAGKSILLGAIELILGKRADSTVVNANGKKCVVEATFDLEKYALQAFFREHDLDFETESLVRREVHSNGKSRAFINDTPVNLSVLKELSRRLVNLLAQHQTLYLNNPPYQMNIIDKLAQQSEDVRKFGSAYRQFIEKQSELHVKQNSSKQLKGEMDFILFQLDELSKAELQDPDEQLKLEQSLKKLENAEAIEQSLTQIEFGLQEDDPAILTRIYGFKNMLGKFVDVDSNFERLQKRFESVLLELEDLSIEIKMLANNIESNPQLLIDAQGRLDMINRLLSKHQLDSISSLLERREELEMKRQLTDNSAEILHALEMQLNALGSKLLAISEALRSTRKKAIPLFEERVQERLKLVGFKAASFKVQMEELAEYNHTGKDQVYFNFAANPGTEPTPLKQVASGGELSRLMLCVQSLLAGVLELPTIIFDEIDNGISGEVANKVGNLLEDLAEKHQLIVITHLPQIASKGEAHFLVQKEMSAGKTVSRIQRLSEKERITEIAKMLSGERPGESALANAKELLAE